MSYGDGLVVLPGSLNLATAATLDEPSFRPRAVETAAADLARYRFPFPVTVLGFGLHVTEAFAVHATDPVFSLDFIDKDTARTEILALTVGSALKRSDGSRVGQTALAADSDIVLDDVVMYKGTALPKRLQAGATLIVEHKTAAGEAGGEVVPVILIRVEGYDLQNDAVLS